MADITRSNAIRALKAWAGIRGQIPARVDETIIPVVVLDEGWPMPVHDPWSFSRTKGASPGNNSAVAIFNKDRRPDDPEGEVKSIVIIDHVIVTVGAVSDLTVGIIDSSTAGLGTPNSAASMMGAFQPRVAPPYKVTGVGFEDGLFVGVLGDQVWPMNSTRMEMDVQIYLGPGHAFVIQPSLANTAVFVWARGRYYTAP